jgi:hypothetical protein
MVCTLYFFLLTGAVLCEEKNPAHIQANLLRIRELELCFIELLKALDFLKGPKHEIFEIEFFTQIRPVRIGDLGTGEKN